MCGAEMCRHPLRRGMSAYAWFGRGGSLGALSLGALLVGLFSLGTFHLPRLRGGAGGSHSRPTWKPRRQARQKKGRCAGIHATLAARVAPNGPLKDANRVDPWEGQRTPRVGRDRTHRAAPASRSVPAGPGQRSREADRSPPPRPYKSSPAGDRVAGRSPAALGACPPRGEGLRPSGACVSEPAWEEARSPLPAGQKCLRSTASRLRSLSCGRVSVPVSAHDAVHWAQRMASRTRHPLMFLFRKARVVIPCGLAKGMAPAHLISTI